MGSNIEDQSLLVKIYLTRKVSFLQKLEIKPMKTMEMNQTKKMRKKKKKQRKK